MDTAARVLLCIEDNDMRAKLKEICLDSGLNCQSESSVESGMSCVADADILILDWNMADMAPDPLLEYWQRAVGKRVAPVAILYHTMPEDVHVRLLSERHVWNVLPYPTDPKRLPQTVMALLIRYSRYIHLDARLRALESRLKLLVVWLVVLTALLGLSLGATVMSLHR